MIPNNYNCKKVHIQITTYTKQESEKNMNHEKEIAKSFMRSDSGAKFICSICLNTKPKSDEIVKLECNKRRWRSCPICHKDFDLRCETSTDSTLIHNKCEVGMKPVCIPTNQRALSTKIVQTSETDVSQGLNLLNEVLTVFQNKKHLCIEKEKHTKTVIVKDASVETENLLDKKYIQPKLTVSQVFSVSIDENVVSAKNKFTIVNCSQPRRYVTSQYSIDLIKHKSSSIPQMKLEELKHSLKEKTRSKDAIEEVNRMFATVRNNTLRERIDEANRPLIRHGPRVLPVVKTENKAYVNEVSSNCKFCQTNNYLLSSGDSFGKAMCCKSINDRTECVNKMRCYKCCLHSRDICE